MHEPGSRETAVVLAGTLALVVDGSPPRAAGGRQRHLRRRPSPSLRERRPGGDPLPRRNRRRPQEVLTMPKTMFDKIWEAHEVSPGLIYIDLHLVHEVTSPQAFDGLRLANRKLRRPDKTLATADHNTPTDGTMAARLIADQLSRVQVETLERNCEEFGDPDLLAGLRPPGHRPRDRPRAGRHPAGDDDRLRRQPHLHPRRLRRAGLRDRHLRGRARARDPVPGPEAAEDDADQLLRRAAPRRHAEGPDPGDDRPPRHRRHDAATRSSTPALRSRRSRCRAG